MPGFPLASLNGRQSTFEWDSRECPGPISEAALSRPSPRRVLTLGALALAVIAPAIESSNPADAGSSPPAVSQKAEATLFDPLVTLAPRRAESTSRSAVRRMASKADIRPAVRALRAAARQSMARETARLAVVRETVRARYVQQIRRRAAIAQARSGRSTSVRMHRQSRGSSRAFGRPSAGMSAVIAYARQQIGKRYVSGAEGPFSFDCSGFTKRAYARAGLRLPHSSGAQAARARPVSRSSARAGDLVVGRGHVGIYMGNGMMIDAGNSRVGVVYRKLYAGLRIERF
jgi:cell wall-associated NlpC family hydrolase